MVGWTTVLTARGLSKLYQVNQSSWYSNKGYPVSVALNPARRIIAEKIQTKKTLCDYFTITPGCKPYQRGKGKPKQTADTAKLSFLETLHNTLNASDHPIRNQLLRLTADSPDLLAVIKKEGKV